MRKLSLLVLLAACFAVAACGGKDPLVGTWSVDSDALLASMTKAFGGKMPAGVPEAMKAKMKEQLAEQAKGFKLDLQLKPDGTWTGTFDVPGKSDQAHGTWTAKDGEVHLVTLGEDGKPATDGPKEITGHLEDGALHMRTSKDQPFDLVLRKK